jgi:hypothetical protein
MAKSKSEGMGFTGLLSNLEDSSDNDEVVSELKKTIAELEVKLDEAGSSNNSGALQKEIDRLNGELESRSNVEWWDINDIVFDPIFENFLPINNDDDESITNSMKKEGFWSHHPVVVWKEKNCLIDGNTRVKCAMKSKIKKVPVVILSFKDVIEAKAFAYREQMNRRDTTDAIRLSKLISDDIFKSASNLNKAVREYLNVGKTKANQLIKIAKCDDDKIKSLVMSGAMTVNVAWSKLDKDINKNPYKYKPSVPPEPKSAQVVPVDASGAESVKPSNDVPPQPSIPLDEAIDNHLSSVSGISKKDPSDFSDATGLIDYLNDLSSKGHSSIDIYYIIKCLESIS